ncbi:putative N-formylglutamate amidohydrolase [Rubricella aquisinus]|uniref:Putative N-formylglutamate amidohydrolase n=1 Tax=Rubricella aquisinus TaxID=2028108 RepID=A0A840WUW8_9RHOB|nr:putative N-formylglutamate amidohydrolase [Rubricella aquisinus]
MQERTSCGVKDLSTSHPAVLYTPGAAGSRVIVICDHASNAVPPEIGGGDLGLPPEDMARHIAYDVGALGVARVLAARLGATLIAARWSRLVIDPNRAADDPTLVRRIYDGSIIPANRHARAEEVARRKAAYYAPYHQAIEDEIAAVTATGQVPVIVSVHSFTPQFKDRPPRPWHIGILWDEVDGRIAQPLMHRLRAEGDLSVGENEPYAGVFGGDTLDTHALSRGLPNTLVEIRNDLIEDAAGQKAWADRLALHLSDILCHPETARLFTDEIEAHK